MQDKQRLNHGWLLALLLWAGCQRESAQQQAPVALTPTLTLLGSGTPPPVATVRPAQVRIPAGMILVSGGRTYVGSEEGQAFEKPRFWVEVKPFLMDIHPVTVAQFRVFVTATKHQTEAEKFGDGGVFNLKTRQWDLQKGATWHHPQGPQGDPAPDNHPVTQVSWNDAQAYARWAGKRLPHELEWEHAARNGQNSQTRYPFGDSLTRNGTALANTWNGRFPDYNHNTDGFLLTSPVGQFGKTPLGLTDMTGNVWQWCDNARFDYAQAGQTNVPAQPERVQRGGSFLCEPGWCHGYRVSGRSFTTPETSLLHVGFRCVRDVSP